MPKVQEGVEAKVCANCLFHHECKNLCTMSPVHIPVDEARKRLEFAKKQLHEAIEARTISEQDKDYLSGVLDRGEKSCQKAIKDLQSKK